MSIFCRDYRLLISRKVDNDLKNSELIDLNNHINICERCYLYEKKITSLKILFNSIDSDNFFHFSHTTPYKKREPLNFIKYASVVVASVFLFVVMFSLYIYIDRNNNGAINNRYSSNTNYIYSEESSVAISDGYYPMSTFIFYENVNSSRELNSYDTINGNSYNNGYFNYMMPVNY